MAAQQPFHGEPAPFPRSMFLDGLQAVGAAGGCEAAAGPDHRGDEAPIKPNPCQENSRQSLVQRLSHLGHRAARYSGRFVHRGRCLELFRFQHGQQQHELNTHLPTYVSLPRPSPEDHAALGRPPRSHPEGRQTVLSPRSARPSPSQAL